MIEVGQWVLEKLADMCRMKSPLERRLLRQAVSIFEFSSVAHLSVTVVGCEDCQSLQLKRECCPEKMKLNPHVVDLGVLNLSLLLKVIVEASFLS